MEVQWLGLCASTAGDMGSIPGQGTKIPHAVWHGQKQNQDQNKPNKNMLEWIPELRETF